MGLKRIVRYLLPLIAVAFSVLPIAAQRQKNCIFLFDCTGSMEKHGLWTPANESLEKNIELRREFPGVEFSVIPFGDNAYEVFSFEGADYAKKKKAIDASFAKYLKEAKYTNISDVLRAGFSQTDPNKQNEIYLFTDGEPNGSDSSAKVAQTINQWCANHRNTKLYYVALKEGVINPTIREAIEACPDAEIVQCKDGVIPVIADISTDIYTSLMELGQKIGMTFDIPGNYRMSVDCADPYFGFNIVDNQCVDGIFYVTITDKDNRGVDALYQIMQGEEYLFEATVHIQEENISIVNPTVRVHVSPEMPKKLTLAGGEDELATDGAEWYDKFLWSDASVEEKVSWDLAPKFENELRQSCLAVRVHAPEGEQWDYQVWFNGEPIKEGGIILIQPGQPAVLEAQFAHDAKTGKRYIQLSSAGTQALDLINDAPAEEYRETSLRTEYDVCWNPLKTLLFWLAIILIALLLLWFLIFKRVFFPAITLGQAVITGPGQYYTSKRIKGARKIILTSKKRSQNWISRLFTGEVRFIRGEQFTSELAIVAAGGKKKVRIRPEGKAINGWDIFPSAIFRQFEKGTLTNRSTGDKSEIEFN